MKALEKFEHNIDRKFAVLLRYMKNIGSLSLLKVSGLTYPCEVTLEAKFSKITVKAPSKPVANEAIEKISDFIDDLNLIRLDVKEELAIKVEKFRKIRSLLSEKGLYLFGTMNKTFR